VLHSRFEPLGRDLSRLVLGTAAYAEAPLDSSLELLDAWLELGGNAIDTARQYHNAEPIVARWLRERGCRDDVVLCTKGGHYDIATGRSRVNPDDITADLHESLATLGVDSVDLYWLHRDDPVQPVGPLLETLDGYRDEGLIRAFGASNWSLARLEEAQAYADTNGLEGFACSSPQLSLAVPAEEPWPGCVTIHDADSLAWYARTQLPVFAWSTQAQGFFAGRMDEHVSRVYDTPENRERLARAERLAAENGATPNQVALAWVLHREFPTYGLIGPRNVDELHESVGALELELTPDQVRWLDLG
jgi:aryl-alcohol dehydrogenase-like predicted oxidoreductase